jgi:DNA-binding transcriptional LysR family regulator
MSDDLKALVAVVEAQSLTKASSRLYVTQSASNGHSGRPCRPLSVSGSTSTLCQSCEPSMDTTGFGLQLQQRRKLRPELARGRDPRSSRPTSAPDVQATVDTFDKDLQPRMVASRLGLGLLPRSALRGSAGGDDSVIVEAGPGLPHNSTFGGPSDGLRHSEARH